MEPFLAQLRLTGGTTTADSSHDGWIIIDSMSSPIYRSIPEG